MRTSSKGSHIILIGFLISGVLTALGNASLPMPGSCSVNEYLACAPDAECKDDLDAKTFTCTCKDDVVGDGLKGEHNTGCVHRCQFPSDCHTYAFCNEDAMCQCNANFTGDGIDICNDIDECENPNLYCHNNAKCRNSVGGYSCTCDEKNSYFGDGVTCIHKCTMDNHCSKNEECNNGICECEPGYKEMSGCKDINECLDGTDECDAYGVCINTDGGYKCPCKNGYTQDGEFGCKAIPKTCHDIWMENNNSDDGEYVIDPDGPGEIEAFEVECEMREIGITIINSERTRAVKVTFEKRKVEFTYEHSLQRIRAIIESSGFCYQEHRYQCRGGALLMDGSNYWKSGNNEHEKNWGGSVSDNMCACGKTGYCTDRASACNCNGTTETMNDNGKVIDKNKLPLVAVSINPGAQGEGHVNVGPVKCGPNPFDIPLNCHEYKFDPIYKVRTDGSYFIDSDGQKGELKPELVYCDMETYTHVGVTVIPHGSLYPVVVPEPGEYHIEYIVGKLSIKSLIEGSQYCMQEVSYECKNSRLMNNGDHKGFTKSLNGGVQNYWAGGHENTCGCGLLGVCDEEEQASESDEMYNKKSSGGSEDKPSKKSASGSGKKNSKKASGGSDGKSRNKRSAGGSDDKTSKKHAGGYGDKFSKKHAGGNGDKSRKKHAGGNGNKSSKNSVGSKDDKSNKKHAGGSDDKFSKKHANSNDYKSSKSSASGKYDKSNNKHTGGNGDKFSKKNVGGNGDKSSKKHTGGNDDKSSKKHAGGNGYKSSKKHAGGNGYKSSKKHAGGNGDTSSKHSAGSKDDKSSKKYAGDNNEKYSKNSAGGNGDNSSKKHAGGNGDASSKKHTGGNGDKFSKKHAGGYGDKSSKNSAGSKDDKSNKKHAGGNGDEFSQNLAGGKDDKFSKKHAGKNGYKCNCDIRDDKTRTDFGIIRDKTDLPVGSLTFKEIGGNSSGTYHVGPLMCGGKEFGIPATCQDYVEKGYTKNYAFLVDPDGPQTTDLSESNEINQPAFPVYCEFRGNPLYAITIVKHNHERKYEWTSSNDLLIEYTMANKYQLKALVSRHVTCTQEFMYSCKGAPIHDASGNSLAKWWNSDDKMFSYFAGDGSNNKTCGCGLVDSCDGDGLCSCDVGGNQQRNDDGVISDKQNLPIAGFSVTKSMSESSFAVGVEIGSLQCKELFPNCAEQKLFNRQYRLEGETIVGTGSYVIDADGNGEVEPFYVQCIGSKTVINVEIEPPSNLTSDSDNGVSRCYNISYKSNGYPVTPEQVQALVQSSRYCTQELTKLCLNAPLTNHTTFKTCDWVEQAGWAGSKGEDMCACGSSGKCAGGPGAKCNCDLQNGEMLEDGAWISDKNRLAVCQVCESLDSVTTLSVSPKKRQSMPTVSDLFCDSGPIGKSGSCQDLRNNGMKESGTVSLTPKGSESAPFYCGLQVYPPMGWTEIYPKEPVIVLNNTEVDITIYYYVYSMEVMYKLIEQSTYCTQELHLDCVDSSLSIGGKYGWYSRDGVVQEYWAGAEKGTQGCKDGECQCNLEGVRVDGGVVQELLPISRIVLAAAPGERTLRIGPVKCYNIYRDCHEILKKRARTNPLKNNTYPIDPDQGGPIEPFAAFCDFKTDKKIGITVIEHLVTEEMKLVPQKGISVNIEYEVTYKQIHSLASISDFCLQGIKYICRQAPLTGTNGGFYYNTFGMEQSPSFGVADSPEVIGCPCVLLNTCPEGYKCHCDAVENMFVVDYGFETNRNTLPLQTMVFPKMSNSATSVFDITNVRCAPTPFDLPKHCDEAFSRGYSTGEILIWPSKKVKPFLVYCDMKVGKGGVTIIGTNYETEVPITFNSTMKVSYTNAYSKQIVELVLISSYCYQPFKINCRNMKLLNGTYASWHGDKNDFDKNSFGGEKNDNLCNCGRQGYCAGDEAYDVLEPLDRPCNCDASDGIDRLDAGVFNYSGQAIQTLYFADSGLPDQNGAVTLGKLYCSEHDFDINECKEGWHDCHEHAKCINRKGYFECKCRSGWEGLGRKDNETVQWANGRNCYDDDECHLKMCPSSADCENTPGSFICTCKDGYRQTGARSCADIDECAKNTHTCHENAQCINLPGSYDCRCDWNFKGDGFSCEPVALCACFGDPHCLTFDQKLITFQGTCQYVMARDMCDNINDTPTFELLMSFYVIPGIQTTSEVSWVKELDFNYDGYTIKLLQDNEVWVNDRKKNLPYKKNNIEIRAVGKFVEVYTQLGLQLTWDGKQDIELYTPGQFMNKTCGFCGNYNGNPKDDLMIGPACKASEGQVTTNENVFGNSWVAPDYAAEFPQCVDCDAENETDVCTGQEKAKAKLYCDTIFDKNGEFKACFEELETNLYESFKYSCVYDACRMGNGDAMKVVCDSAEMMVDVCSSHFQIEIVVEDFRKYCELKCNENMEYQSCGSNQQVTCYDILTETEPDVSDLASCVGGCFCKENFYLSADGKSCVPKEECGCFYENENYKIGDVITSDDCSGNLICQANGTMTSENIICHKDAVCKLKKGRQGCHCKKDFYGDGVISCEEDKCLKNPCGTNETCIQNKKAELGYECRCQMGFMGDCGNCTEVDECLTKEDDCPYKAHCINTVGSFKCECKEGYDLFGGVCRDENECSIAKMNEKSICRNNSQCSNRIGTFECPCCNGFEEKNGKCVESSTSNENSPTCCVCNIAKCEDPREICGEDGQTYKNMEEMYLKYCELGKEKNLIKVDYFGKCKSTCAGVKCQDYQNCTVIDDRATCICAGCTEEDKTSPEVCTKDKVKYDNMCEFKTTMCYFDIEFKPSFDMEPCNGIGGAKPVGPWGAWGQCSVTCGKGTKVKTRTGYNLSPAQEIEFPLELPTDCYMDPCPGSPCVGHDECPLAGHCVVNSKGEPTCECPMCENIGVDHVCGYIVGQTGRVVESSWKSECHLRRFVCSKEQIDYGVVNEGFCGAVPRNCTRVPLAHTITDGNNDEYKSKREENIFDCEGGCGFIRDDCCQPIKSLRKSVYVYNSNGDRKSVEVKVIEKCGCVDIGGEL